jgi:hypothetical protein
MTLSLPVPKEMIASASRTPDGEAACELWLSALHTVVSTGASESKLVLGFPLPHPFSGTGTPAPKNLTALEL